MGSTQKKSKEADGTDAARRVLTPVGRGSYLHIFKPKEFKGKTKYSATFLFPKDETDMTTIRGAVNAAMVEKFGKDKSKWPTDEDTGKPCWDNPIRDGDRPKFAGKEGYKGHWVVKASCGEDFKPGVFDRDGDEIVDSRGLVSGDYVRGQIYAIAWDEGKSGASFLLDGIQLVKKGEPLSARGATKFDPIGESDDDGDAGQSDSAEESDDADEHSFM